VEPILFVSGGEFRLWLMKNCLSSKGIWLLFGKEGGPQTVSPQEALNEALCFGWIDSQIKSIDDNTYMKYFSPRRKGSEWSEKNKQIVAELEKQGRMTDYGRLSIEEAKRNGTFKPKDRPVITQEMIEDLAMQLRGIEPACANFGAMSPSVKRTYTALWHEGKTEGTRNKTLAKIVDRLNRNLKPM
jgi:uncharacterized protein YdeI (YjbR/CyaY-like superfamily)